MTANEQLEDQISTLKRGYFSRHWHGELSLAKSYWINFWFLSLVFTFILVFWMTLSINENPVFYSRTMLIIIAVIYLIIYPWQIIGYGVAQQTQQQILEKPSGHVLLNSSLSWVF